MKLVPTLTPRREGFTLIELMIAVAILALVIFIAHTVSTTGLGVFRSTTVRTGLDTKTLRAIDGISTNLEKAAASSLFPPAPEAGTSQLTFQEVTGFAGGEAVWGEVQELAFEYETGEIDDGMDNNHNGLVDEGVVVLLRDAGGANEQRVVLCHGVREHLEGEQVNGIDDNDNGIVDEKGFCLQWVDGVLALWLSIEQIDENGVHQVRTLQTSVRIRNET
jgi:prepilin-type N-terminal cleavage/methylation domain-containing protein